MDFVNFISASFEHFLGFLIVFCIFCGALTKIAKHLGPKKHIHNYYNTEEKDSKINLKK